MPASGSANCEARTGRTRISRGEIANFSAQLAIMVRSGVDVTTALKSLSRQCRSVHLARILDEVHERVLGGATFSQALRSFTDVFGSTYVATVAAGEASGKMAHVLGQLAEVQRNEQRLLRTIRSLLAYPILLASVSSLVVLALVLFVLPQFASIFDQYETPLPTLTQVLIFIAEEIRGRWWLYGPLAIAGFTAAVSLRFSRSGRRAWDRLIVHAWLVRDVSRSLFVGRICRLLGLMLQSGVPLIESLKLTRKAITNSAYDDLFDALETEVLNGRGLSRTLCESEIIPPAAGEMLATAERSGNLGDITRLVGEHYEEEGEAKMRQVVTVLEPLITVGMGVVVAIVVLAVMLPMFDLATFAQN